jgi:hypothetical protein
MENWKGWMTEKHWEGLEILSKMAPFNKPLIIDHMIMHHSDWDNYINKSDNNPNPRSPGSYAQYEVEVA